MYNVKEEKLENVRRTDVPWFQGEHFTFFEKCTVVTPSSPSTFREIKSKFKSILIFFMYVGVWSTCTSVHHTCYALMEERTLGPLELELQVVARRLVGARNQI